MIARLMREAEDAPLHGGAKTRRAFRSEPFTFCCKFLTKNWSQWSGLAPASSDFRSFLQNTLWLSKQKFSTSTPLVIQKAITGSFTGGGFV